MVDETRITRGLGAIELLAGIGAVLGGTALAAVPSGALLGLRAEMLYGTPFHTYMVPGAVLCLLVGGPNAAAGILAIRQHPSARVWAMVGGSAIVGWTFLQIAFTAYRPPVPMACLLFTAAIAAASATWIATTPKLARRGKPAADARWLSPGGMISPPKTKSARATFQAGPH